MRPCIHNGGRFSASATVWNLTVQYKKGQKMILLFTVYIRRLGKHTAHWDECGQKRWSGRVLGHGIFGKGTIGQIPPRGKTGFPSRLFLHLKILFLIIGANEKNNEETWCKYRKIVNSDEYRKLVTFPIGLLNLCTFSLVEFKWRNGVINELNNLNQ